MRRSNEVVARDGATECDLAVGPSRPVLPDA